MIENFIHIPYCYNYLIDQISVGLLVYAHIPTAIFALVFGIYVAYKTKSVAGAALLGVCASFAAWGFLNIATWFAFLGDGTMMFGWITTDLLSIMFFFFAYYFLYAFTTKRDLPLIQKIIGFALLLPTALWIFLGSTLTYYDANTCEAAQNETLTLYPYFAEAFILLAVITFVIVQYRRNKDKVRRQELMLAATGVILFLGFFLSSTLATNFLVSDAAVQFAYNFEIYGLFGMPILLAYLGYLIVRYHAFDIRIFGTQALVLALVALIGSEFAFLTSLTNRILVAITLSLTAVVGMILIRSVKREIEQRKRIEHLAKELEKANDAQVTLIHFITHQIKGFVSKSRNIFSMALEGDFGPIGEQLKPMLEEGLRSDTKGAQTIQEILNASNIKSGKVAFTMAPFDLRALIEEILKDLKPAINAKGLELKLELGQGAIVVTGDRSQLMNAYKNIIDNSIKYTPTGTITVSLSKEGNNIRFLLSDTGVGITPEDMRNLFTEGGHGKESTRINVDSTGFGLYIVKNIIETHKGKVWAESEGAGKGSRFIIELPA